MEIIPVGDSALVVRVREQFEDAPDKTLDEVLRVFRLLQRADIPGVIELAPAYTSVAVFFDPIAILKSNGATNAVFDELVKRIRSAIIPASRRHRRRTARGPRLTEIPVCYDAEFGIDLDRVSEHTKLSAARNRGSSQHERIPRGMHWVRSWFYISGRITEEFGNAAARCTSQRNSSRFRWHRRCANGDISVALSGRLESHRPHSGGAFRSD